MNSISRESRDERWCFERWKKNNKTWNHHHDTDLWIVGYFRGISRNSGKCFRILHGQFIPCRGHRRVSVIRGMGGFWENSNRSGMRGDGWPEASLLLQQGDQDLRLGLPSGSATACRVPRLLLLSTERWVWKGVVLISDSFKFEFKKFHIFTRQY